MESREEISYVIQQEAIEIDHMLMGPLGFTVDQLMELAGLSVASAIGEVINGYEWNQQCTHEKAAVIISVDIPSGWHVEEEDICGEGIEPDMLVSLTAPKLCAKMFRVPHHFLGGRFVPRSIIDKFKLKLPSYPGTSMCVRIGNLPQTNLSAQKAIFAASVSLEVEEDPIDQFQKWFGDALAAGIKKPHYMVLSTAGKDAKPSSRMISLEGVNKDGFVWHTNYGSRKAREISENPHASLLFYWGPLKCQVRVEGSVEQVSDEESDRYFSSLPRDT
ncbi:hypothetical protein K7X08_034783 [Anisodus acutangulus]|uniref:pyridoxal 5'-phosphate synthase n=1 Tax=Anisodus acutangulus TaxID=402998 RepID=A0A9Q1LIV7_9SOLA|nr:hypothetical protein K7X08_034783 [Anisodus acutangulus]